MTAFSGPLNCHPAPSFALDQQLMSIELPAGLTSIVNQAVVPKAALIKQHGIKQHGGDLSGAAVCLGICASQLVVAPKGSTSRPQVVTREPYCGKCPGRLVRTSDLVLCVGQPCTSAATQIIQLRRCPERQEMTSRYK